MLGHSFGFNRFLIPLNWLPNSDLLFSHWNQVRPLVSFLSSSNTFNLFLHCNSLVQFVLGWLLYILKCDWYLIHYHSITGYLLEIQIASWGPKVSYSCKNCLYSVCILHVSTNLICIWHLSKGVLCACVPFYCCSWGLEMRRM